MRKIAAGVSVVFLQRLAKGTVLLGLAGAAGVALAQSGDEDLDANVYQIGPGDVLSVFVWRQEELQATVPVRPDGLISTPLVEDMVAVGKTPTELARDIEQVLAEFIRSPQVTIIVDQFAGASESQIRVLGQVANPGSVPYRENMTVLTAILEAGGITDFASGNRSTLSRVVDGEREEIRIRLEDLLERGHLHEDMDVMPGDVIVVPQSRF